MREEIEKLLEAHKYQQAFDQATFEEQEEVFVRYFQTSDEISDIYNNETRREWFDKIEDSFKNELRYLGFREIDNPFIFLVKTNLMEFEMSENTYKIIHNAFVNDEITDLEIRGKSYLETNHIIFNRDFYTKNISETKYLLNLHEWFVNKSYSIGSYFNRRKYNGEAYKRYTGLLTGDKKAVKEFIRDLFYRNGCVINGVMDNTKYNLKKGTFGNVLNDIEFIQECIAWWTQDTERFNDTATKGKQAFDDMFKAWISNDTLNKGNYKGLMATIATLFKKNKSDRDKVLAQYSLPDKLSTDAFAIFSQMIQQTNLIANQVDNVLKNIFEYFNKGN